MQYCLLERMANITWVISACFEFPTSVECHDAVPPAVRPVQPRREAMPSAIRFTGAAAPFLCSMSATGIAAKAPGSQSYPYISFTAITMILYSLFHKHLTHAHRPSLKLASGNHTRKCNNVCTHIHLTNVTRK